MKIDASLEAATRLARVMERKMGFPEGKIDPIALRLFIRAYGGMVSSAVNTIRDDID